MTASEMKAERAALLARIDQIEREIDRFPSEALSIDLRAAVRKVNELDRRVSADAER